MEIPPLKFMDMENDREKLIGFLWWTHNFLELLVLESGNVHSVRPLFSKDLPGEMREEISQAWDDLIRQKVFDEAANTQKEVAVRALEHSGLTGVQLSFKLRVLRWICQRFGLNQSPSWLRRVLKAIDDILDSIASANPVAHAIKEFKDALGSLTEQ